jgi:CTP:molybdopterin cytidylyltransferase MocA
MELTMSDAELATSDVATVPETPAAELTAGQVTIRFDDKDMVTSYANVASVATTTDEILLLFGTNKGWAVAGAAMEVGLSNRIIMTPTVARGLADTLSRVLSARTS